jgi:hypothetical protein
MRTEVPSPDGGTVTVISSGRDVELGARSMLVLAEGLFRLDVVPYEDTIQTILRNLSPHPRIELRLSEVGGGIVGGGGDEATLPSTGHFGGEVLLVDAGGRENVVATLLVGSTYHPDRGLAAVTAQAKLA